MICIQRAYFLLTSLNHAVAGPLPTAPRLPNPSALSSSGEIGLHVVITLPCASRGDCLALAVLSVPYCRNTLKAGLREWRRAPTLIYPRPTTQPIISPSPPTDDKTPLTTLLTTPPSGHGVRTHACGGYEFDRLRRLGRRYCGVSGITPRPGPQGWSFLSDCANTSWTLGSC